MIVYPVFFLTESDGQEQSKLYFKVRSRQGGSAPGISLRSFPLLDACQQWLVHFQTFPKKKTKFQHTRFSHLVYRLLTSCVHKNLHQPLSTCVRVLGEVLNKPDAVQCVREFFLFSLEMNVRGGSLHHRGDKASGWCADYYSFFFTLSNINSQFSFIGLCKSR